MKLEADKVKHFFVSMGLVLGMFAITKNPTLSVVTAFVLGAGKEVTDSMNGKTDCLEDMLANLIGIIAGQIMIWFAIEYNIIRMIR